MKHTSVLGCFRLRLIPIGIKICVPFWYVNIFFVFFYRNFQNYGSSKQQRIQSEPEKVF